jgi:hypothetical protein
MSEDIQLKQWNVLAALEVQLFQVCRGYLDQRRDVYLMTQLFSFLRPCEVVITQVASTSCRAQPIPHRTGQS